jgi:maleate isomerase
LRLTVGVLTPHAAPGPDVEIPAMTAGLVDVVVARQGAEPPTTAAGLRALATLPSLQPAAASLQPAAASLCEAAVDVIAYASTTTGYAIGPTAEASLIQRLSQLTNLPVVSSGLAAIQALKTFAVRRVALIHPPWFENEMTHLGETYFGDFDVTTLTATPLPIHPDKVRPEQIIDYITTHVDSSTQAIFIAGNGFRAASTIKELEHRTNQLVLEANQLLLWSLLTATRSPLQITTHGRLFHTTPSPTTSAPTAN